MYEKDALYTNGKIVPEDIRRSLFQIFFVFFFVIKIMLKQRYIQSKWIRVNKNRSRREKKRKRYKNCLVLCFSVAVRLIFIKAI